MLTRGGLRAGVDAFVARLDLPVAIDVPAERLPAELEASAYFIVAEGLTNVTKHSRATRAEVKAVGGRGPASGGGPRRRESEVPIPRVMAWLGWRTG